jgi:oxaloacetate decarboxylase gamma subunit
LKAEPKTELSKNLLGVKEHSVTIGEMFGQSAILTVLGMTVVFAFIWLMVLCMGVFARLINRFGWDKDIKTTKKGIPANTGNAIEPEVVAAISVAVTEYRKTEG